MSQRRLALDKVMGSIMGKSPADIVHRRTDRPGKKKPARTEVLAGSTSKGDSRYLSQIH
jgi:hypothetical protein